MMPIAVKKPYFTIIGGLHSCKLQSTAFIRLDAIAASRHSCKTKYSQTLYRTRSPTAAVRLENAMLYESQIRVTIFPSTVRQSVDTLVIFRIESVVSGCERSGCPCGARGQFVRAPRIGEEKGHTGFQQPEWPSRGRKLPKGWRDHPVLWRRGASCRREPSG
jgi:hypothetical protein